MSEASWRWLESRAEEVQQMEAEAVAELLTEGLAKVDDRVSTEVSDRGGERQIVLTADGEADVFSAVRALVASAPTIPGVRFIALRPPQGFECEVQAGALVFEAKALSFQPLSRAEAPAQLAVRLLVPNPQLEEWAQIGWQVIETGVGEEVAARIGYLEIGTRTDDSENVFALESLGGYIERHSEAAG